MTNLICFGYMHFKSLILQTFTFICTTDFTDFTTATEAFLGQSPLPVVLSLEMLQSFWTISLTDKSENELTPFTMEAWWVFSLLYLQTALALCFHACLHNCSNFLKGESWDIQLSYISKSWQKHSAHHGKDRSHSYRIAHAMTHSPKEVVLHGSCLSQTFQRWCKEGSSLQTHVNIISRKHMP